MKTLRRAVAFAAVLPLLPACGADPTSTTPELRRLELSHITRVVTVHQQISVEVWAFGASFLRITPPALEWSSSDPATASVDQNGLITGHRLGRVKIIASGGGKQASIEITVRAAFIRVLSESGTPDLLVGERTVLHARFVDANGLPVTGEAPMAWSTSDAGVADVQPIQGDQSRSQVVALKPGLARLSAGSDGVQGSVVIAVLSDREANPAIHVSDFHIVPVLDVEGPLWMQPSLRVVVAPGRSIDLERIDVALDIAQPLYPALCASTRLQAGSHEFLGFGSYPPNADLYLRFYQRPMHTDGVALLAYREAGVPRTAVFRETDNVWDYDYVIQPVVPWRSC